MQRERKRVAVLFGGRSVEHEISIITALQLIEALDSSRFEPVPVYIAKDGSWYSGDSLAEKGFYRGLPDSLRSLRRVALLPVPGIGGLTLLDDGRSRWLWRSEERVLPVDVYFPVFHGTYGEDGCLQGLLELADVAYTGSGVLPSALGMDKFVAKWLEQSQNITGLPASLVGADELRLGLAQVRRRILEGMDFPLFIKPSSLGSSVGIGRAENEPQLDAALIQALEVDQFAIVEPCISHLLEINVAVLADDTLKASVVEIPVVEGGAILSYEAKYMRQGGTKTSSLADGTAGTARVIDPVDLPLTLKQQATSYALNLFELMRCSGVARVDFIYDTERDRLYFNEINTLPGSLAFYLWAESKPPILYTELLSKVIERAEIERNRLRELRRDLDLGFRSLYG